MRGGMMIFFFISTVLLNVYAECGNIHCKFEYLGAQIGSGYTEMSFMKQPAVSEMEEKYCRKDFTLSLRQLNWLLYQMECAAADKDPVGVSNAVTFVSAFLDNKLEDSGQKSKGIMYPNSLRMKWLEKIEYSIARIVLSDARGYIVGHIETLLPDGIIDSSEDVKSRGSIKTFKQMLYIAAAIEDFHAKHRCYPVSLDAVVTPKGQKCSFGKDIEYEWHKTKWILRCRCESWEGGLRFDEYLPMVFEQRKKLDLCLSSTYNVKRRFLYEGESYFPHDDRLSGCVIQALLQS